MLDARGHEVHLFGPPGSRKPEHGFLHLIPCSNCQVSLAHERQVIKWYEDVLLDMDVVHDASASCRPSDWLHWFAGKDNFVAVRNGIDATFPVCGRNVVCLSKVQRGILTTNAIPYKLSDARVVPYGVDLSFYTPGSDETGYFAEPDSFLFLARPHPHKGVETFIRLAKACPGENFLMAWKADAADHKQWEQVYLEAAKGIENLKFYEIPDLDHHTIKASLYRNAKALVVPLALDYVEAFGLVFIEALASGTPVITATHGACPEVIDHGDTGFLCKTFDHYVNAVKSIDNIPRAGCRKVAERRFSRERMVDDYLKLHAEVMAGRGWGG